MTFIEEHKNSISYLQQYETLKIPLSNPKIKGKYLGTIFEFLKVFSKWLMPQGRTIGLIEEEKTSEGTWVKPLIAKKQMPEKFSSIFHSDYIVRFNKEEIEAQITSYFGWPKELAVNILEYLCYDLNYNYKFIPDFLQRPIIKAGDNYYWLSSILRDRHWGNIIYTRIVKDHCVDLNNQTKNMESAIADLFTEAKFKAVPSKKYGNEEGEIDTIAYKDGILLFVELKTTYVSEDLLRQAEFDNRTLEYKAGNQLSKAVEYYDAHFDEFASIEELGIDRPKESIQVATLIVSNIFDWDDSLKKGEHLKISLMELEVILKNRLFFLLNFRTPNTEGVAEEYIPLNLLMALQNSNDPNFKVSQNKYPKEDCNLWKNSTLSAQDFFEIIGSDSVWKFLDSTWNSNINERYELSPFNPNRRWLG